MRYEQPNPSPRSRLLVSLATVAVFMAGCAGKKEEAAAGFATPEEAAQAFVAAIEKNDLATLEKMLGPKAMELLASGDPVADATDRKGFLASYAEKNSMAVDGETANLVVGPDDWSLPIPIVKRDGKWAFDGEQGIDELIYRRVGSNELGAIDVMYGFVNAQLAYAAEGRDGDPPGIFAIKLMSDPGLHNGLYWETAEGEPESPAGPLVASAAAEGYTAGTEGRQAYHGYYYRMLYAQGTNANGGAKEYFKDGVLTEGFAAIAWPSDYGSSGVMTFVVNQDGVVFQKDLGDDTATVVEGIKLFDPDATWTAIVPPEAAPVAATTG